MNVRRFTILGIGVLAGTALFVSGCAASKAKTASAADKLNAAISALKSTGYNVTLSQQGGQETGAGSVDPSAKAASLGFKGQAEGQSFEIHAVQIKDSLWMSVDLGGMAQQLGFAGAPWMTIDQSKLTGPNAKPFDMATGDALDVAGLLASVSNVKGTDATHLSGTVDLTKATGVNAPSSDDLSSAGDAAKAAAFTATIDSQGRLIDLKIDGGSATALTEEIQFADFGSPNQINTPVGAMPAPAQIYTMLNN